MRELDLVALRRDDRPKCAAGPCDQLVNIRGEFCVGCRTAIERMRQELRANRVPVENERIVTMAADNWLRTA